MVNTDLILEQHYMKVGARPQRKDEETLTTFNRDIFWYNRDELSRQADRASAKHYDKITYEDHRRAIETAVYVLRCPMTQYDVAMCILTNRFFKDYRAKVFAGEGDFILDYSFLIVKVAMIFNASTSSIKKVNLMSQLESYTKPTLIQINHITGTVSEVKVPNNGLTLNEWGIKFNKQANESTSYRIVGHAKI